MDHAVSLVSLAQTLKPGKTTHSLTYSHIALQPSHWPFSLFPVMLTFPGSGEPEGEARMGQNMTWGDGSTVYWLL